jgi:SAM-dependent methyltransferase
VCDSCRQKYPIINGVPIVFPDGRIPDVQHEAELPTNSTYNPWVHRVILQSLLDDQIVVNLGSGNMALDDPCIIRMDVILSPYVDIVADAHALPFLPESIDYIFSLAVYEHLYNPFLAARSMYEVLKDGGYIYHECNFVFAYHGYPHHYFNASQQGLEQVFSDYVPLRIGVAPYQMPSFALNMMLSSYIRHSHANEYHHGKVLIEQLQRIIDLDLIQYDIYFSETEALNIAAGTYFAGMKQITPGSTLVPLVIREKWESGSGPEKQLENINDLTTVKNIMTWAVQEGRKRHPAIDQYLSEVKPFNKREGSASWNREYIRSLPLVEPQFGAVGFDANRAIAENAKIALERFPIRNKLDNSLLSLFQKVIRVIQHEGIKGFLLKVVKRFTGR